MILFVISSISIVNYLNTQEPNDITINVSSDACMHLCFGTQAIVVTDAEWLSILTMDTSVKF